MRAYDLVLYVHLLGVFTLFAAAGVSILGGARLRRAATVHDARLWLDLIAPTGRMFPIGLAILLLSGLAMTAQSWSFTAPWIVIAILGVVALGAIGGAVQGQRFEALGKGLAQAGDGPLSPELAGMVTDQVLWRASAANTGIALGIGFLMVTKPGWVVAVVAVVVFAALAVLILARPARPTAA